MTELELAIGHLKNATLEGYTLLAKLERASKDLEKPSPHKWKHGDVFRAHVDNIMIYLDFTIGGPRLVCVVGLCGGLVEKKYFNETLREGKFLFNIKEKL